MPGAAVLGDGDRADAVAHAAGVEPSVVVVDLARGQPRHGVAEREDVPLAVGADAGDLDMQRPGDEPANVEERQAALVLLVGLGGLTDDLGLGMTTGSAPGPGGISSAAVREMPIRGAATPMPLLKTCCSPARCSAPNSAAIAASAVGPSSEALADVVTQRETCW